MGIWHIKIFTASEEKIACPFAILCVITKVFCLSDVNEKYFEVGPFT